MCRPFGRTHALRRMIPGMVTLIVQDPIRVHLYRHVVIMIQDDRSMTEIALHSTTREVTKATNPITIQGVTKVTDPITTRAITKETGHNQTHTLEDLGRVNLSTLAVAINTRHVTLDSSSSSIAIDKDLPTGYVKRSNQIIKFNLLSLQLNYFAEPSCMAANNLSFLNEHMAYHFISFLSVN